MHKSSIGAIFRLYIALCKLWHWVSRNIVLGDISIGSNWCWIDSIHMIFATTQTNFAYDIHLCKSLHKIWPPELFSRLWYSEYILRYHLTNQHHSNITAFMKLVESEISQGMPSAMCYNKVLQHGCPIYTIYFRLIWWRSRVKANGMATHVQRQQRPRTKWDCEVSLWH